MGVRFRKAVDRRKFGWLREDWERWCDRRDLLDYVIVKGADFTVKLIQKVESAKKHVLAALFDQGEKGMIDDVFRRIEYGDWDLDHLTNYRPELAVWSGKFFTILDKMEDSESSRGGCSLGCQKPVSKLGDTIWLFHL